MSDIAIRVENLSKIYRIGARDEQPRGLMQAARSLVSSPFAYLNRMRRPPTEAETLWALRDVSFEVKHGEVLGIIGRNGAGKSTLLKILSRITEPSSGEAQVFGRIASLLEVGTGFHPELTGRENIYLNGAILGMKRTEIDRKFDEIVDFSGVERFLDTPVKRYSSGMYVRLAFAVAAHLEPEILLVDEVLAVGDAAFQKKALGKMADVVNEGRTVLFVSHNMGAISTLTQRALLLTSGRLLVDTVTSTVVSTYLSSAYDSRAEWQSDVHTEHPIQIRSIRLVNHMNQLATEFDVGKGLVIQVEYVVREPVRNAVIAVNLHASDGAHVLSVEDIDGSSDLLIQRLPGVFRTCVELPGNWLNSGTYLLRVGSGIPRFASFDNVEALQFSLIETGETTKRGHRSGYLLPMLSWKTEAILDGKCAN